MIIVVIMLAFLLFLGCFTGIFAFFCIIDDKIYDGELKNWLKRKLTGEEK